MKVSYQILERFSNAFKNGSNRRFIKAGNLDFVNWKLCFECDHVRIIINAMGNDQYIVTSCAFVLVLNIISSKCPVHVLNHY